MIGLPRTGSRPLRRTDWDRETSSTDLRGEQGIPTSSLSPSLSPFCSIDAPFLGSEAADEVSRRIRRCLAFEWDAGLPLNLLDSMGRSHQLALYTYIITQMPLGGTDGHRTRRSDGGVEREG